MALIETVTARLTADVGQFEQGFAKANQTMGGFQRTTHQTNRLTNNLKAGMQALAFQAIGLPGPLGRVSNALLTFAGGSFLTLGVLAGLAAIGTAFAALAAKAEEAEKALRATAERIMGHLATIAASENLAGLQARRRELQEEIARLQGSVARQVGGAPGAAELRATQELSALDARIAALGRAAAPKLAAAQADVEAFAQSLPLLQIEVEQIAADFLAWADATDRARQALEFLQRTGIMDFDAQQAQRIFEMTGGQGDLPIPGIPSADEIEAQLDAINQAAGIGGKELDRTMAQLGLNAMESLSRGLIQGTKKIEELIFQVLLDFALGSIWGGIAKALGITSPSKMGIYAGQMIGEGLVTGMHSMQSAVHGGAMALAPTGALGMGAMRMRWEGGPTMPPAMTPFEVARDAHWQRTLRESFLVARSDGFR